MSEVGRNVDVTDASFDQEVLKANIPALVDFWATWCAPCKAVAPILDELSQNYDGKVKFTKLNVDENPMTCAKYGIRSIPTLLLFKEGKVMAQEIGAVPKKRMEELIKKAL